MRSAPSSRLAVSRTSAGSASACPSIQARTGAGSQWSVSASSSEAGMRALEAPAAGAGRRVLEQEGAPGLAPEEVVQAGPAAPVITGQ